MEVEKRSAIVASIDPDLSHIPRFTKQALKQGNFVVPVIYQLCVEPERSPDAFSSLGQLRSLGDSLWDVCDLE